MREFDSLYMEKWHKNVNWWNKLFMKDPSGLKTPGVGATIIKLGFVLRGWNETQKT